MCGIAGIIADSPPEEVRTRLTSMIHLQRHRGPDDSGFELVITGRSCLGLGSCRLAVQDLSPHGHQPMRNGSSGDLLVFNGEIYNFPDLRRELEARGHRFVGRSDTEVLLKAWQEWGSGCIGRLRGMFAFALWEARRQRLFLARDPLGIKPLYYGSGNGAGFAFASEVRALVTGARLPATIDRHGLAGYLAFGSVQEPATIFEGIHVLPPGSWMEVGADGRIVGTNSYWVFPRPDPDAEKRSPLELKVEGKTLLHSSVRRHLISDAPLAVFLSSGLDSTALLGLARNVSNASLRAFTVSFQDDPRNDEAPLARRVASRLEVEHRVCDVDSGTALDWATDGLRRMDQPSTDGLNTFMVSRAVRSTGVVVALSGQGGDEMFGGYPSFRVVPRWSRRLSVLRGLPDSWRTRLVRLATCRMDRVVQEKASDMVSAGPDLAGLYLQYRRVLSDTDLKKLGIEGARPFPDEALIRQCMVAGDPVASVSRLETACYLRNTLLRDGDVFGMANSIEIRVPLLDQDVVEWSMRLPGRILLPEGAPGKCLLRQICHDFFLEEQLRQPKRGFTAPFSAWIQGPLRELVNDSLDSLKRSGLLNREGIESVENKFRAEPDSAASSRLWTLAALGFWLEQRGRMKDEG